MRSRRQKRLPLTSCGVFWTGSWLTRLRPDADSKVANFWWRSCKGSSAAFVSAATLFLSPLSVEAFYQVFQGSLNRKMSRGMTRKGSAGSASSSKDHQWRMVMMIQSPLCNLLCDLLSPTQALSRSFTASLLKFSFCSLQKLSLSIPNPRLSWFLSNSAAHFFSRNPSSLLFFHYPQPPTSLSLSLSCSLHLLSVVFTSPEALPLLWFSPALFFPQILSRRHSPFWFLFFQFSSKSPLNSLTSWLFIGTRNLSQNLASMVHLLRFSFCWIPSHWMAFCFSTLSCRMKARWPCIMPIRWSKMAEKQTEKNGAAFLFLPLHFPPHGFCLKCYMKKNGLGSCAAPGAWAWFSLSPFFS